MIDREKFIEATGREPEQDDLERCNCERAGEVGHSCCGWNAAHDKPQFDIGPNFVMDALAVQMRAGFKEKNPSTGPEQYSVIWWRA